MKSLQILLILHLWTKVPILTEIVTFKKDETVCRKRLFLRNKQYGVSVADRRYLMFRCLLGIFILPMLSFYENEVRPLSW